MPSPVVVDRGSPKSVSSVAREFGAGVYDGVAWKAGGEVIKSLNPSTGKSFATIVGATKDDYERCISSMVGCAKRWASSSPVARGEIVRQIGEELQKRKEELAMSICQEMGKVKSEALGEVQEFIDVCHYACGVARCIPGGSVFPSERQEHMLMEVWNPLGIIGVISAFNFPVAVYGWNLAISLICGNCVLWKGASSTCGTTVLTMKVVVDVMTKNGFPGVCTLVMGPGKSVGEWICKDSRIPLVSFTGSTKVGRGVSEMVHSRFGRTILELGGNNASIVMPDADLDLAVRGSVFGAVGTCGQRCTSLRRLLVHEAVYEAVVSRLVKAYKSIIANNVGSPGDEGVLLGPLHTKQALETDYLAGLSRVQAQGGKVLVGGKSYFSDLEKAQVSDKCSKMLGVNGHDLTKGFYVEPTIVEISASAPIVQEELFVPILYVIKVKSLEEAIEVNNGVPQGLSSSLYTTNFQSVMKWVGPLGSDCGIVNVNAGTSGAEIGGAFGGEKETGGGREAGSDSWKQYMRRSTCTLNFGNSLPLAQGVKFDI